MLRLHGRTKATYSGSRRIDPYPSSIAAIASVEHHSYEDDHQHDKTHDASKTHDAQTHGQTEERRGQAVQDVITKAVSSGEEEKEKDDPNEVEWNTAVSDDGTRTNYNRNSEEATCISNGSGDKDGNDVNHKGAFVGSRTTEKAFRAEEAYPPSCEGRKSIQSTAVGKIDSSSLAPAMGSCGSAPISAETLRNRGEDSVGSSSSGSGDGIGSTSGGDSEHQSTTRFLVEDIKFLNLHSLSLQKLYGIERLLRLKVADLSGNELHDTAPLQSCSYLEELNLAGNELTSAGVRGLMHLHRLAKLDLGYNQISDLHFLCKLTGLLQLSIESNLLHNLRGLDKLVNLKELYCGNNDIASTSELDRLKHLPRLIILDISGNPVSSSRNFRPLVLYKIPNLKVLDGVGVSRADATHAKMVFTGKLTEDVIRNKYEAGQLETLEYLDLGKGKWRSVEVLSTLPFRVLRELNLEKNFLVNFAALGGLPALSILRLSYNRIKSIGQPDIEADNITSSPRECTFLRLEVLYLGFNRISDIAALCFECMPRLLAVDLQGNSIGDLRGLNHCRSIVEVNLNGNKIRQLGPPSALTGLNNLQKLRLEGNGLRVIVQGLASFTPSLLSLSLAQNRLADPTELDRMGVLPNLVELSIGGNPMVRRPHSRRSLLAQFPSLVAVDSINITSNEHESSLATASGSTNRTMAIRTAVTAVAANVTENKAPRDGEEGDVTVKIMDNRSHDSGLSSVAGGSNHYEHTTVVIMGGFMRKSGLLHVGSMTGSQTAPISHHVFSPIRPQGGMTPACGTGARPSRSVALPGKLMVWGAGRKERSVRATTNKANTSLAVSPHCGTGRFKIKSCGGVVSVIDHHNGDSAVRQSIIRYAGRPRQHNGGS